MRAVIIALVLILSLPQMSAADPLDDAKAAGLLGEKPDGYLGLVDANAPADIQVLMAEINAKREAKYAEIAEARDVPIEAVGMITAKKVYEAAPAGTFFMDAAGGWQRK